MKLIPTVKTTVMKDNASLFWESKKRKLKQKYSILSDKDLSYREGNENEMIDLLRIKLGKTRQELLSIIVSI